VAAIDYCSDILVGKSDVGRQLGIPRLGWEDRFEADIKPTNSENGYN
jgi:hypothetical protein